MQLALFASSFPMHWKTPATVSVLHSRADSTALSRTADTIKSGDIVSFDGLQPTLLNKQGVIDAALHQPRSFV